MKQQHDGLEEGALTTSRSLQLKCRVPQSTKTLATPKGEQTTTWTRGGSPYTFNTTGLKLQLKRRAAQPIKTSPSKRHR